MTDFLFAVPSFLSGVSRVVDLGGHFDRYNSSPTAELADRRALQSDCQAVEKDLSGAATIAARGAQEQTPA